MMQVVEQTHDETAAMYLKNCTKKQLAEMLTNCNEIIAALARVVVIDADNPSSE